MRARALTTLPDSTSRKFILFGSYARGDSSAKDGKYVIAFLDFAAEGGGEDLPQCDKDKDMEKWYARTQNGKECLMGHKVPHDVSFHFHDF